MGGRFRERVGDPLPIVLKLFLQSTKASVTRSLCLKQFSMSPTVSELWAEKFSNSPQDDNIHKWLFSCQCHSIGGLFRSLCLSFVCRTVYCGQTVQDRPIWDNHPTNVPEMTSLAASPQLQNAIKYYTKCVKRVQPAKESNNSTTV